MRGRLTIEKVNGCIDEINALFEEKYAILALSPVTMNAVQMHKYTVSASGSQRRYKPVDTAREPNWVPSARIHTKFTCRMFVLHT